MKRPLQKSILALPIVPLLLAAAFYGYENLSSEAEWRKAESLLAERGEPLHIDALKPRPVAEADNMALAPVFRDLFIFNNPSDAAVSALQLPTGTNPDGSDKSAIMRLARRFKQDFSGDSGEAARVVLDGIAPMSPTLDAVATAAQRPGAVWPINYALGFEMKLPFLSPLRATAEVLAARGTAAVLAGDSASALKDLRLIVRLATCSNQPPVMIGCVSETRVIGSAADLVEAGLASRAWSPEQLRQIEVCLNEIRPLDSFRDSIRGERALFVESVDELTLRAEPYFSVIDFRSPLSEALTRGACRLAWNLRPSGWKARDRAKYVTLSQEWLSFVIHNDFVRPWALAEWNEHIRELRRNPFLFFQTPVTALALPSLANVARSASHAQARIDIARIACTIEMFRLETGRLPPDLAALAPSYLDSLPRDVIGGGKYLYKPDQSGNYVLYSRGWNGRDDGGVTGKVNPLLGMAVAKDWVWEMRPTIDRASLNPAL